MSADDLRLAQFIATVVGPLVVAALKHFWPDLPKSLRPVISVLTSAGTSLAAGGDVGEAGIVGILGLGVRDVVDRSMVAVGQRSEMVRKDEVRALKHKPD